VAFGGALAVSGLVEVIRRIIARRNKTKARQSTDSRSSDPSSPS
jgi:hypothetical protein